MAEDRGALDIVRESRVLAFTLGTIMLIAGVILLAWPKSTLHVVAWLSGLLLVVVGIGDVADTFRNHRAGSYWGLMLLRGLINVGFGLALVLWPKPTVGVLVWLIGLDLVLAGVVGLVFRGQMPPEFRAGTRNRSILTIVFGVIIMVWPKATVAAVALLAGLSLVLTGLVLLWTGWQIGKMKIDVIEVDAV